MANILDAVPHPPSILALDEEANRKVADLCSSLYSETTTMQACIALFDHASGIVASSFEKMRGSAEVRSSDRGRDDRIARNWPSIAAREALSTLYNFHWALKELNTTISENPAKDRLPKPNGVRDSYSKFYKKFSKALLARHAASHRAELINNSEKNAHKAASSSGFVRKPKGVSMMMSDCLIGRTYTGTRKGEILKFDVTWKTYVAVLETYMEVIASVAEAEP